MDLGIGHSFFGVDCNELLHPRGVKRHNLIM
jgi:hypothetical protein